MDRAAHIDGLNRRFGVTGVVEIVAGSGGLPMVRIRSDVAAAEISLYGAQVLRWKPAGADEVLYLSERSRFEQGEPIRGGIPICFPWFRGKADDPRAPKHGFVRTREWWLDSLRTDENGTVTLVCVTGSDEGTRIWWPHEFLLAYRIGVGRTLRLELSVVNRGSSPMEFEEALHTYFHVGDVERTRVRGLEGATYLDNMDHNRAKRRDGELVIAGQTDNAYLNSASPVVAMDAALGRRLRTEKSHSTSTVVWNPWREGAAGLADMSPEDWRSMLCVEASNVLGCAVTLGPGEEHTLGATLSVERE